MAPSESLRGLTVICPNKYLLSKVIPAGVVHLSDSRYSKILISRVDSFLLMHSAATIL